MMSQSRVVYLPKIVEEYSFKADQRTILQIQKGKITIILQKSYESRVKDIEMINGEFNLTFFGKDEEKESTRLMDI